MCAFGPKTHASCDPTHTPEGYHETLELVAPKDAEEVVFDGQKEPGRAHKKIRVRCVALRVAAWV